MLLNENNCGIIFMSTETHGVQPVELNEEGYGRYVSLYLQQTTRQIAQLDEINRFCPNCGRRFKCCEFDI